MAPVLCAAADNDHDWIHLPRGFERGGRGQQSDGAENIDLIGRRGRVTRFGHVAHPREMKDQLGPRLLNRATEYIRVTNIALTPLYVANFTRRKDARSGRMKAE